MTNRPFKPARAKKPGCFLLGLRTMSGQTIRYARSRASFVFALDLAKLGFRHADRGVEEAGQPPYDPADLLKLYLYGYINQVRSSRRLEREACRNLELIWLLSNLRPGYRTIANFRKGSWKALKAANRRLRAAGSGAWTYRRSRCCDRRLLLPWRRQQGERLDAQEACRTGFTKLDQEIEAYGKSLEDNDAAEAKEPGKDRLDGPGEGGRGNGGDIGAKVAALMAKRSRAQADLDRTGGKRRDAAVPDRSGRPTSGQERPGRRRLQCADRR